MQGATQAYAKTAQATANPRELEAQLLLKAASQLQAIQEGSVSEQTKIMDVLRFNRRLWSILITSVTNPDNPLPGEIKQNVAALAAFILKQTLSAEMDFDIKKLTSLISINREIAAGLRGKSGQTPPQGEPSAA